MHFRIIGQVRNPETFARGKGIRELQRLQKAYGPGRWRKRKGDATIELPDGLFWKPKFIGMKLLESAKRK